ncbi:MAG: hypothetical protein QOH13_2607 [Thermoleophilaceae bacterium]|jgi:hypothetical protein|nr:hypothetical protein [Thermoleophilaceae bacterium]
MRRETTETGKKDSTPVTAAEKRAERTNPTKQAHERLLRALSDRRLKRAFGS